MEKGHKNKHFLINVGILIAGPFLVYSQVFAAFYPPPAIIEFGATPAYIEIGETAIIYWVGINIRECIAYGDWDRSFGYDPKDRFTDTEQVSPREPGTYKYGLKCRGEEFFTPAREIYLVVGSINPQTTGGSSEGSGRPKSLLETVLGASVKSGETTDEGKIAVENSKIEERLTGLEKKIENISAASDNNQIAAVGRAQSFVLWFVVALVVINFGFLFYVSGRLGRLEKKHSTEVPV